MTLTQRDSRTYRHRDCGECTTVSGGDLDYVANIFDHPDRTYCQDCGDNFPMHEFSWDETDESLTDYYSRYAGMFKGMDRFLASSGLAIVGMGIGAILGGVIGFLIGRNWGTLLMIGACVGGAAVVAFSVFFLSAVINERVCKRVLGTDDFNSLE